MPQAIDLVVNDGQATPVARTFALLTPSASDGSSAIWQYKSGANSSVFPTITASARKNASRTARKLDITVKIPYAIADVNMGITRPGSAVMLNASVTVPDDYPETSKADATAFVTNVFTNALIKAMVRDAVSAS